MKKSILSIATIIAITMAGCSSGGGDKDETTTGVGMTVKYANGTTFGVVRANDELVNGGYAIYNVGTGEQNGFIQLDASVNNLGGVDLGICAGAVKADGTLNTECTLPINPSIDEPSTDDNGGGTAGGGSDDSKPRPTPTPDDSDTSGGSGGGASTDTDTSDDGDVPIADPDADDGATGGDDADSSGAGGQGSETGAGD